MANPLAITTHSSNAEVASGHGSAIDISSIRSAVRLLLDVTAAAGTLPSLTVAIETSPSGGALGWRQIGAFTAVTAPATFPELTIAGAQRYIRAAWTITGTLPSFTFALSGFAHTLYAAPADISRLALPSKALTSLAAETLADACLASTDEAAGYFAAGYTLPLVAWGDDVTRMVAKMAAFTAMSSRGFQPGTGIDDLIVKGYDDAVAWCRRVGQHAGIEPPGIVDSTQNIVYEGGASVASDPSRGGTFW